MAQPVQQQQVQQLCTALNVDWTKVWAMIQKLSPYLQQMITVLLQESQNSPAIVGAEGPPISQAEAQPAADAHGIDVASLLTLLQTLGPVFGKLLLAFLTKTAPTVV